MNFANYQVVGLIFLVVAVKLFLDHRKPGYTGVFDFSSGYPTVSGTKHDVTKVIATELFPIIVFGLAAGEKFFDPNNFLNSAVGRIFVTVSGYFVYHELILPYVVAKLNIW